MPKNKILDSDFYSGWGHYVNHPDEIIWEGRPKKEFTVSALANRISNKSIDRGFFSSFGFIAVLTAYFAYQFWNDGNIPIVIAIVILGSILMFGMDIYYFYGRSKTKYAVTEKWILFRMLNWGKLKIYAIPTDALYKLTYEEYEDKSGTLHFVTDYPKRPKTRNLQNGQTRFYPTFEGVFNVMSIYKGLKQVVPTKGKTIDYKPKNQIKKVVAALPVMKMFQTIFIVSFVLFTIDFYLLPTTTITDRGINRTMMLEGSDSSLSQERDSYHTFKTQKGLSFGPGEYFYRTLGDTQLEITYTPIFKSVKGVKSIYHNYRKQLRSDLNGFNRYYYFLTFIVIAGGRIALMKINKPDENTIWKVILSSSIFLGFALWAWFLYN